MDLDKKPWIPTNPWIKKGQAALLLAPMEGVTDGPMRTLLSEICPFTHLVTDFLRVSQMALPKKAVRAHMRELGTNSRTAIGTPVFLQILGGHPERLAQTALHAVELGASGIDLNFGCPAPTVNRHDGGATLLLYPERIYAIVSEIRQKLPPHVSVSVKMRLGWDSLDAIHRNAERAAAAGASWITIHARTKVAGYRPPAYWKKIAEVKRELTIPVIANGEIWTIEDFRICQEESECEHYMLGRGVLANPFLAWQVAQELKIVPPSWPCKNFPTSDQWREFLQQKILLCEPFSHNPIYALARIKQWLKYVNTRRPFATFDQVKRCSSLEELKKIIAEKDWLTLYP